MLADLNKGPLCTNGCFAAIHGSKLMKLGIQEVL